MESNLNIFHECIRFRALFADICRRVSYTLEPSFASEFILRHLDSMRSELDVMLGESVK